MNTMQQTIIPMSMLSTRNIQPGDTINFNVFVREANKTLTRWYKVMTVDKVNELISCVLDRETEMRV
jgi:hypothetical protein